MTWIITARQRGDKESGLRMELDDVTAKRVIEAMLAAIDSKEGSE